MSGFLDTENNNHRMKNFKGFKEYVDNFSYEILEREELEDDVIVYNIEVDGNIDIPTCAKKFLQIAESEKFEEDALLIIECKNVLMLITNGMSLEQVLKENLIRDIPTRSFLKKKIKEKEEAERKRKQELTLSQRLMQNVKRKDSLFGFKQRIAAGNPDVMRILDRVIAFMGQKKAEGYMKLLDKEQITTEEMYDAMKNDSLGNVATLSRLIKNSDSRLFVTEEEQKINKKKKFGSPIYEDEKSFEEE